MLYSRVVLSAASGSVIHQQNLPSSFLYSLWFSAAFHALLFFLLADTLWSVTANSQQRVSALSVQILSQAAGFSATQSADSSKKFQSITTTSRISSPERQDELPAAPLKPAVLEGNPSGPFSGARRGPFNLGMGTPSFSYGQRKSAQDAERHFRDLALAKQAVEMLLRDLTSRGETANFSGRCRLSRDPLACDFEAGIDKDRLVSFWEFFSKQYPFIEAVEIMKIGRNWALLDLITTP